MKRAIRLAGPIAGAYLVVVTGLLAEYLIVARSEGAAGVAALGLAGTLALVLVLSFHAIEIAVQGMVGRRYGAGDLEGTGSVLDNALILTAVLALPIVLGLGFLAPLIFTHSASPRVAALAGEYFFARLPGLPCLIAVLAMIGFFNSIGRPVIPMAVYAVIIVLNVVLCVWFVGGGLGLKPMGIRGAGLAQTVSAVVGLVGFLGVLLHPAIRKPFRPLHLIAHADGKLCGRLMKTSLPVFGQQFMGNFGMYLFILITAQVPDGGVSLAASTLARNISFLTYLPSLGFGLAAATLVAQGLGAGEVRAARMGGLACWILGAIFMVAMGLGFIFLREPLVDLFIGGRGGATNAVSPAMVKETAMILLILIGLYQLFESANTILGKALQGAGSTLLVMIVSLCCQWLLFLPLAWLLAITFQFGAAGAIAALGIQLIVAGTVLYSFFQGPRWQRVGH